MPRDRGGERRRYRRVPCRNDARRRGRPNVTRGVATRYVGWTRKTAFYFFLPAARRNSYGFTSDRHQRHRRHPRHGGRHGPRAPSHACSTPRAHDLHSMGVTLIPFLAPLHPRSRKPSRWRRRRRRSRHERSSHRGDINVVPTRTENLHAAYRYFLTSFYTHTRVLAHTRGRESAGARS